MDAVFALADQISVLVSGKIISTGKPDTIRRDSKVQSVFGKFNVNIKQC